MASAIIPNLQQKPRGRRALSWKLVTGFAGLTLFWWIAQPGHLMQSADWLNTTVVASQPATNNSTEGRTADQPHADHGTDAEAPHTSGHVDPVAQILLAILIILLLAKVSGDVFERVGMPAVLGELTVGIVLGNWQLMTGSDFFEFFKPDPENTHAMTGNVLDMLSRIGVVLLLFEVGLESRVKEMASVGMSSLLVAMVGVIAPMALGFGIGYLLVSEDPSQWQLPAFLGATLCATSVGITRASS